MYGKYLLEHVTITVRVALLFNIHIAVDGVTLSINHGIQFCE